MGVGKSTLSFELSKEMGYEQLSWEDYLNNFPISPNKNYIVDGFHSPVFKEPKVPYEIWNVVAPVDIIYNRYYSREYIPVQHLTKNEMARTQDGITGIPAVKKIYPHYTKDEIKLMFNVYPLRYQYIEIDGVNNDGDKSCIETWNKIKHIDFKDKVVADLGCYAGYFCFEVKKAGAKEVIGIDWPSIASITKDYARLNRMFIKVRGQDLDEAVIESDVDIMLLLNTLHHLRSPFFVLWKCFKHAKTVILEVELPHNPEQYFEVGPEVGLSQKGTGHHYRLSKELITSIASENHHKLKETIRSARPNRVILVYEHE